MTDFFSPLSLLADQLRTEARRFQGMIFRGIVRLVDDSVIAQALQVEFPGDDVADEVEHAQPFGLSFRPPTGDDVEAVVLHVGGDHDHPIAVCVTDRTKRPAADVEPGEGGLYIEGVYRVFIAADGVVHLGAQDAADFVALASAVDARLNDIEQWMLSHTHPFPSVAVNLTAATTAPGFTQGSADFYQQGPSTAAENVRAT